MVHVVLGVVEPNPNLHGDAFSAPLEYVFHFARANTTRNDSKRLSEYYENKKKQKTNGISRKIGLDRSGCWRSYAPPTHPSSSFALANTPNLELQKINTVITSGTAVFRET